MRSRIRRICQIGAQIVYQLVDILGISLAEVNRQVGVSASAISEALDRTKERLIQLSHHFPQFSQAIQRPLNALRAASALPHVTHNSGTT